MQDNSLMRHESDSISEAFKTGVEGMDGDFQMTFHPYKRANGKR